MTVLPDSASEQSHGRVWGVLVTFCRPECLRDSLGKLSTQTRPLDELVVVDNGSDPQAASAAMAFGASYIDSGANLGPAGAIAIGMEHVLKRASDRDWLLLLDDDDPPSDDGVIEALLEFAQRQFIADEQTAAVAHVGARYDRKRGVLSRIPDIELRGSVGVDYVGGGQFPLFRCDALREVGVFDRNFFFGFDDAEFGLRLRSKGYRLYVDGDRWVEDRRSKGRLNLSRLDGRTSGVTAAWRRYYSVRNATVLARRYGSPLSPWLVAMGGCCRGVYALARARRPISEVVLPMRAAFDGLRGKLGATIDPGFAAKTSD